MQSSSLFLFSLCLLLLLPSFSHQQDINDAIESYVTNQRNYACSTREDCCLKAQATLRSIITSATDYSSATKFGTAIYPKCSRGWNYNSNGDLCTKVVPFSPKLEQPAFVNLTTCLSVTAAADESGDFYERQKECMRPWWMVHEECVRRTFNNCLKQDMRCIAALFDDWTTQDDVKDQYD